MATRDYDFPVWGTQGGGLVREVSPNRYIFVEAPDCPGLGVGDYMPEMWGVEPANDLARGVVEREEWDDDDVCDIREALRTL